jgi:acetyl-CoA synthetase
MHDALIAPERTIQGAQTNVLSRMIGMSGYDEMLALSVKRPDVYWRHVCKFLGIEWARPFDEYIATPQGLQFPRFFVGGRLNWTITALKAPVGTDGSARKALIAISENGRVTEVTYAELKRAVGHFAGGLQKLGVRRGDRIGLYMESCAEAAVSLLAVAALGAIAVPLFSGFGVEAIASRLRDSSASVLIASGGFHRRGRLIDNAATIARVRDVVVLSSVVVKRADGLVATVPESVDWQSVADCPDSVAEVAMDSNDPFMIIYTSGTTGRPKGTVHTHGGFPLKIAHDAAVFFDLAPGDVWFWPCDMGWVAGPMTLASALIRKTTLVMYDGAPDFPDWRRIGQIVESTRATHLGASPTLIRGLASNEKALLAADRSTVRILITAGEVIDADHFRWYSRAFGDAPVINFTGGTEVTGGLLSNVVARPIVPGGFNTVSPAIEIDVVDVSGRPVVDQVGELAIRKPFPGMTQSFWGDDARYLETYWNKVEGLWIHGDLAMKRSDGAFFLLGRSDDTLKIAGKRVGPAEVEEIVAGYQAIAEVAAIGIEDAKKGERLVVFVTGRGGQRPDEGQLSVAIAGLLEKELGKAFRPSRVHVVGAMPKTKSGKVMRRLIRNWYTGTPAGDLSGLEDATVLEEFGKIGTKEREEER